jgi:type IV secretory pathway TrbD component
VERGGDIDGFEVPFHNSLAEPIMLGGVPRMYMIGNFVFTMELCLGMGVWWLGIPAGILIHAIGYALTKRDPYFFGTLSKHLRQKPYWDA